MPAVNRDSGRHALDMAAPALAFAAVFLFLRAANQTPDGLSYAVAVRTGAEMFHPHHLIYVPIARVIHQVTGIDPILATLWQNLFWVVVLAFAARRLAGAVLPGRWAPVLAAVGLLALRGVMIYSVRVETYLPAMACLALAAALARERPVRAWLLVPVLALAILYHQTNVLVVAPLLVLLGLDNRRSAFGSAGVLVGAGALVLVAYLLAAGNDGSSDGFWAFSLNYAYAPIQAWGNFGYFSAEGVSQLALSQMRMIVPVRDGAAMPGSGAMLAMLVFLAAWHVHRIGRGADHLRLRLFGLVFLAVYLLFFLWWMPSDIDFFVATLLPLWLLVVILINDLPSSWKRRPPAIALVAVLALGNIIFTILPMHRDPGPGRRLALALDRAAPPDAEMVVGYAVQQEMLYFTERTRVHEGDGLARSIGDGGNPRPVPGHGEAPVVIDGILLRELLDRGDPETGIYLKWLTGFDPESKSCLMARRLVEADGVQLGPGRGPAGSWAEVAGEIRVLSQP